jgi:rubrerythrin
MGGVKTTAENLTEAVQGEADEFKVMYPPFVKEAQAEGNKAAEMSFKFALAVEEIHHELYQEALGAIEDGEDIADKKMFVCEICGNTVYSHAPEACPICNAPQSKFVEIQ